MVGYDPFTKKRLYPIDLAMAGVISGFASRFLCQPTDVLKIRFQLQLEPIKATSGSKYYGVKQALRLILLEEGFQALWKGHIPAQALSITYGTVNFLTFEFLTKEVWKFLPEKFTVHTSWNPVSYFFCGALSGGFATTVSYPFDVIRTRLIGQGEPKIYDGMMHGLLLMYRTEGMYSFYRGLVPTLLQIAPNTGSPTITDLLLTENGFVKFIAEDDVFSPSVFSGFQFGFYKLFTTAWHKVKLKGVRSENDQSNIGPLQSFICGSTAGLASKTLTYPLDLLKKRLQVIGFEKARQQFGKVDYSSSLVIIFRNLIVHESYRGLFKGICPSILKAICSSGLTFTFYEQTCNIVARFRQ